MPSESTLDVRRSMFGKSRAITAFVLLGIAALAAASLTLSAQQGGGFRDTLTQPMTGTASLAGQVVFDEASPQPVRRAKVTASAVQGGASKWTMTDPSGNFVIRDLPAGRYTLSANKPGLVRATYGAKRFDRPGTPVNVVDGQHVANLVLKMLHGGVITGVVRDETGQAAPGIRVQTQQFRMQNGERTLVAVSGGSGEIADLSDDHGTYRIFGLPPGDYVVTAMPRDSGRGDIQQTTDADLRAAQQAAQPGATMSRPPQLAASSNNPNAVPAPRVVDGPTVGFAPVFFPGTLNPADAQTVTIAPGEERSGIDLQLRLLHTARVEGVVSTPAGIPPQSVSLIMTPGIQGQPQIRSAMLSLNSVSPGPDGKFVFTGVAPGQYTINARASSGAGGRGAGPAGGVSYGFSSDGRGTGPQRGGGPPAMNLWALAEVTVDGQNISGIAMQMQPGMTITGHLAFEGTRAQPAGDLSRAMVMLIPASAGGGVRMMVMGGPGGPNGGPVDSNGKFTLTGITPGRYTVMANFSSPEATWTLKSAMFKGHDALDLPFDVAPNDEIDNAVITFTDQTQTVSGKLADVAGRPAPDFTIVVFPEEKTLWTSARRIRTARPGTDGRYTIADLPSGTYRIAALTDIAPGEANDPAFLDQLVPASIAFALKDGETKTQDLRIAGGG